MKKYIKAGATSFLDKKDEVTGRNVLAWHLPCKTLKVYHGQLQHSSANSAVKQASKRWFYKYWSLIDL